MLNSASSNASFSPLNLQSRSTAMRIAAIAMGSLALTASSQISVPMIPVPITLQSLVVPLIGALYGWRLGLITVLTWLGQAMLGLPVLAGGSGGIHLFAGPTAGYLVSFPIIAAMTGYLAERGWNGQRASLAFISFAAANLICLALGAVWLAGMIGLEKAIALGVTPFLIGAFIKSALGAAILKAMARDKQHKSNGLEL